MLEPPHARRIHGAAEPLPVLSGLLVFLSLNVRVYRTTAKPTMEKLWKAGGISMDDPGIMPASLARQHP